jgi:hypothetical protein
MRTRLALAVAVAVTLLGTASAPAASRHRFKVTSTLTGKTVLPHRIHWLAVPNISPSRIGEVDFLIDGRVSWVEHSAPYSYGYNANYLVTTWLTPGVHRFKTRAIATNGRRATSPTAVARVRPAPAPPAELAAGPWKREINQVPGAPSGTWTLTIDKVGWSILDPLGGGALVDVAYLSPTLLEARGGVRTKPNPLVGATEGNPWCDEPFQPVRYAWLVQGDTLTVTLAGPKLCDGQSDVWAADWTRG